MKPFIFLLFLFLILVNSTYSQWYQQGAAARSIGFLNSNNGYALASPYRISTSNGGQTWYYHQFYRTHLSDLFVLGNNHCWIILYTEIPRNWQVTYTTNGGSSWVYSLPNYMDYYFPTTIYFLNTNIGWAIGSGGRIHKTTGGGQWWSQQTSNTANNLKSIHFVDELNGWAVGNNNSNFGSSIIKTTDGGLNWVPQSTPTIYNLRTVFFIDIDNGWIAGDNGMLFRTTDAGQSWSFQNCGVDTTSENWFNEIFFINNNNGWLIGNNGSILYTSNNGQDWNVQASGTTLELYSIFFIDEFTGWIAGHPILHTTNGGVSSLNEEEVIPAWFKLEQNYPNPFNPSTIIQYQISSIAHVTLKIFDLLGNEVATLVNEEKPAGKYEVEFDPATIKHHPSSGVYFCRLQTESYSKTIKMLYIK